MKRPLALPLPPLMKIKLLTSAAAACFSLGAHAAPLEKTTAVHTRPDASAPTITVLKAGAEPAPASNLVGSTPAGWMAVELPGPFEGYVENKDLAKSLDVKPGASIRLAPKADAAVLAVAEKGDKTTITGLRGKWTQVSLERKLTGYINLGGAAGYVPPIANTPASATPATAPQTSPIASGGAMAPAPVAPAAYGTTAAGQAAPVVSGGDPSSALPRQFAGRFVSTRRPFTPRRPYDYALNDDAGKRYAYLDTSKLLLTEQIEKYIDHHVVVFGAAKAAPGGKDIVIQVETLQLK
jgi:hypothetical protein